MSEEKKSFSFLGLAKSGLSLANKGLGDRPHKKIGTAIIGGSTAYGVLVDPVGGIIGAVVGLGVRYPEHTLAAAQYADGVVDAILGRSKKVDTSWEKSLVECAIEGARERKASGKMQKGDEDILKAAEALGA